MHITKCCISYFMPRQTSVYTVDTDRKVSGTIAPGVSVLRTKITVTRELLQGSSGLFRVYFAFTAASDYNFAIQRERIEGQFGNLATATTTITNGSVDNIIITNNGDGYPIETSGAPETLIAIAPPPSGTTATATAVVVRGRIVSITITNPGSGYVTPPILTILSSAFTPQLMKFNGDNGFLLKSDGYYRFDIGVLAGDILDFQVAGTVSITAIKEFRIDQIQIGA